jgi:hypothetical protein
MFTRCIASIRCSGIDGHEWTEARILRREAVESIAPRVKE